jgi:hypothetical protein
MPRLIEIVLFLTPLAAFAVWWFAARSTGLPRWFLGALAGVIALVLAGLLWTRHQAVQDAALQYQPAQLRDGQIIPGRAVMHERD